MHTLAGLLFALAALGAPPSGVSAEVAPQVGVVVLKNGHTIPGSITQAGDYLVVTQGAQSELRIPNAEVEFVSADLEQAYARKTARLPVGKAAAHLDLAEWCLRHDMPAQATEQWVAALKIDAEHPRLAAIEKRLKFYAERMTPKSPAPSKSPALGPEDLDKFTKDLPKGAVERFAATVQPILLNRCATGGCHGPNATTEFKLYRPAQGQVANRRFTQRNLHAVMQQIDRSNPDRSALLVKPQERHGGANAPVFDKQSQIQLDQLAAWVRQAVMEPQASQPASIRNDSEALSQPAKVAPQTRAVSEEEPPATTKSAPAAERSTSDKAKPAATSAFKPRDPFDPEQFNRLHHSKP